MSLTEKNLSKFNKNKSSWSTESNSSFGSRKPTIIKPRGYGYQSDTTGLNHRKSIPPIGTLNSPPSSGDESTVKLNDIINRLNKQKKKQSQSDNEFTKKNQSDSEITLNTAVSLPVKQSNIPNGYHEVKKEEIKNITYNTLICYKSSTNRIICGKYFKRYNEDKSTVVISKYKHNRINFTLALSDILSIYQRCEKDDQIVGGKAVNEHELNMKDTIEIPKKEWSTISRDTLISYKKLDGTWKYKLKFGAIKKSVKNGKTYMHLTTETGFIYKIGELIISNVYRHFTSSDKNLVQILNAIRRLDARMSILESKMK
jgi:hypothetical protein